MAEPEANIAPPNVTEKESDNTAKAPVKNPVKYKDHALSKLLEYCFFQAFP